jgi:hypothetical protein
MFYMYLTKLNRFLFLALFLVLAVSVWAQTGNRYALVIGNNNYKNGITALSTPVNDANDVSASLKTLGYETVLKTNTTIADLDDTIEQFLTKLDTNRESEGFFWFAGHGVNVGNKHYLLAVDVDPRNDSSIIRGSYSVDKLVELFDMVKNKANLLVIDACRNDFVPGSRSVSGRGLAVVASDSVVGNVIAYSTRAGQTADDGKPGDRNSPFAAAFLSNIKTAKSFDNLFIQIANDTRTRTNGRQLPYKIGYFTIEDYAIAPVSKAAQSTQTTPQAAPQPIAPIPPQPTPVPVTQKTFMKQTIAVTINVTGDFSDTIVKAYTEYFISRGFKGTEGQANSYLLDVSFALEDVTIQNPNNYKYTRYVLDFSLKDKAGDEILFSSANGRDGHTSQEQARQRAIRSAEQAITSKNGGFAAKFDAFLPSLF